jgi:hypothetical protein
MTHYIVRAIRTGRMWALEARAHGIGIHSQCKRLDQAEAMAREAIALTLDVPEADVEVEVVVQLDEPTRSRIEQVRAAQAAAAEAQAAAASASRGLVRELASEGYTARDAGRLLGVSPQRISQLLR